MNEGILPLETVLGGKKILHEYFLPPQIFAQACIVPKASAVIACGTSLTFLSACLMVPRVWKHLNASVKDQNTLDFPVVPLTSCRVTTRHWCVLKIQYLFLWRFGGQSNFETFICHIIHPKPQCQSGLISLSRMRAILWAERCKQPNFFQCIWLIFTWRNPTHL